MKVSEKNQQELCLQKHATGAKWLWTNKIDNGNISCKTSSRQQMHLQDSFKKFCKLARTTHFCKNLSVLHM